MQLQKNCKTLCCFFFFRVRKNTSFAVYFVFVKIIHKINPHFKNEYLLTIHIQPKYKVHIIRRIAENRILNIVCLLVNFYTIH